MREEQGPIKAEFQPSLSPEAREVYREFHKKYAALQESIETTMLRILIFGPGPGSRRLYDKKIQIRNALATQGHDVTLGEETDHSLSSISDVPTYVRELVEARKADLIIAIMDSAGSVAELHDLALQRYLEVGHKMLLFVDDKLQLGYSSSGALNALSSVYNNVATYSYPEDIDSCNLLGSILSKVRTYQYVKFYSELRGSG